MKLVIVEDEFMVAKRLERFVRLSLEGKSYQIRCFNTLDDAADYLAQNSIDALFLDLNLNGQDGFELLKLQVSKSFQTIVVSANSDRALEAFDYGVLDFVAKPFAQERVETAIQRLLNRQHQSNCKYLTYQQRNELKMLAVEDIVFIKAAGHYSEINTRDDKELLHEKNLEALIQVLPENFMRIHRSYIVNLNYIGSLQADSGSKYTLHLENNVSLPVGRTRVIKLKETLNGIHREPG